tara:strand:+ start:73 stop:237 length:165 start_codon:yes stop_codon:yes gene_type:complete
MSDENVIEYYGFKAADAGKFKEWQLISSSLKEEYPKESKGDLAERAYKKVISNE